MSSLLYPNELQKISTGVEPVKVSNLVSTTLFEPDRKPAVAYSLHNIQHPIRQAEGQNSETAPARPDSANARAEAATRGHICVFQFGTIDIACAVPAFCFSGGSICKILIYLGKTTDNKNVSSRWAKDFCFICRYFSIEYR